LPDKYFLTVKGLSFKKGCLVSISGHHAKYIGDLPLIKRVVGLSGDSIQPLLKDLKKTTKCGKPLSVLSQNVIPEGYVFVTADNKDSYDSRYEEFGLVSTENIKGRAFVLGGKVL
jgi:type IV secretory pathway protease TraF